MTRASHARPGAAAAPWRVGIDASNLRAGGGVTHLVELLRAAEPREFGIERLTVWGGRATLDALPDRPWLVREHAPLLDGRLPSRLFWQRSILDAAARRACDLVFAPGGTFHGSFRPVVTMFRNMLPFDREASALYGASFTRARLAMLNRTQRRTFRSVDGVIFLTDAGRRAIESAAGPLPGESTCIPHGVSDRFARPARSQRPIHACSADDPFRFAYVSIVDMYKHQWQVAAAVAALRAEGLPVTLDLWGAAYPPAKARLDAVVRQVDPDERFIRYHGPARGDTLVRAYHDADAFVFASTCENMPNILLEAMASGLPIACSRRGAMPEVLGGGGLYFEPTDLASTTTALRTLTLDHERRGALAHAAFDRARTYSWTRCARETLAFLARIHQRHVSACAAS